MYIMCSFTCTSIDNEKDLRLIIDLFKSCSETLYMYSYGDVTIVGQGLQHYAYAWHLWPLRRKGSFLCQIRCDTIKALVSAVSFSGLSQLKDVKMILIFFSHFSHFSTLTLSDQFLNVKM